MDCSESRDWAELEYDALGVILNKMVSSYDYLQFSLVCKSWHFLALRYKHQRSIITSKVPQLPLLIVPSKDGIEKQHCLYNPTNHKIYTADFKFPFNKRCCGSSFGWLIMLEETLEVTLFNPFSGSVICLPPIIIDDEPDYYPARIIKAILTKDPSLYPNDYMVVAIYSSFYELCFMRANDKTWAHDRSPKKENAYQDVNVCNDTLYALADDMTLWKVEVENGDDIESSSISISLKLVSAIETFDDVGISYIVESSKREVLLVKRLISTLGGQSKTTKFKVYKLTHVCENGMQRAVKVRTLDGDAIFIGDCRSICVSTKDFPKCLPNCIYFTDSYHNLIIRPFLNGPQDLGIYNLRDKSFGQHYITDPMHKNLPHPIWIVPTICSKVLDD